MRSAGASPEPPAPAPRGRYGDGSWRQLPSGRWLLSFYAGRTPAGTPRKVSVSAVTKRECRDKRRALEARAAAGTLPSPRSRKRLVADWLR